MAISEAFTGSATIGTTEYSMPNASTTLTPRTEDGVYQVFLDTSAITFGDTFVFKVYEKIQSSGSQQAIFESVVNGASLDNVVFPSLILLHGWDVTAKKLAGTDRSIAWSIRKVA